jgi:hypothetical protein
MIARLKSSGEISCNSKILDTKTPETERIRGFLFAKDEMETKECEFGCECDTPTTSSPFDTVLDVKEFQRLVDEKTARVRKLIELQDKINQRFNN